MNQKRVNKTLSLLMAACLVLAMLPLSATPALADEPGTYNPGDIAVINRIIDINGLGLEPADPADGSYIPESWDVGTVMWSGRDFDSRVIYLRLSNCNLTGTLDVSGLTQLQYLDCSNYDYYQGLSIMSASIGGLGDDGNQLTALNVSGLANLEYLDCSGNQLAALDLSGLVNLKYLLCSSNQLAALNLSGLVSLVSLPCVWNQLTALDVSGLSNLDYLNCSGNQLTTLNVKGAASLTQLACSENQLTALDLSGLINLEYLDCTDNLLPTLDVSGLTSLQALYCSNNILSGILSLDDLSELVILECFKNRLTSVVFFTGGEGEPVSMYDVDVRYNYMTSEADLVGELWFGGETYYSFWPQRIDFSELTINIAAPVTDEAPQMEIAIDAVEGIHGAISWYNVTDDEEFEGDCFVAGKVYKATVELSLSAQDNFIYYWPGASPNIIVPGQSPESISLHFGKEDNQSGMLSGEVFFEVTFEETISEVVPPEPTPAPTDLRDQEIAITSPATDNDAQSTIAIKAGSGYTGAIEWYNVTDEASHSGEFVGDKVYKAIVTLTSADDYQWPVLAPSIKVVGQDVEEVTITGSGSGNTLTFEVTFAATFLDDPPMSDKGNWPKPEDNGKEYYYVDKPLVIRKYIGIEVDGRMLLTSYQDEVFWISGGNDDDSAFINTDNLVAVYFDGHLLERDVDYFAENGSVKITIRAETFQRYGEGEHTIDAVFSIQGKRYEAAQTVTIKLPKGPNNPTGPQMSVQAAQTPQETITSGPPLVPLAPTHSVFSDVRESDWFYYYVVWAYDNEYMVGVGGGLFAPYDPTSEAMAATVLARLAKADLSQPAEDGSDGIPPGKWYSETASWAKSSGLLGDRDFSPNNPTTRGELALILVRFLDYLEMDYAPPETIVEFDDAGQMSAEENEAFQILYSLGIFGGVGGNRMDPQGLTNRAQLSALLYRINEKIEQ